LAKRERGAAHGVGAGLDDQKVIHHRRRQKLDFERAYREHGA
jgi:hypothetical protein